MVDVLGGKKKKKGYSTPKKNKHRHKNVRLHVLSYYTIKGDGKNATVEKVKRLCDQKTCKGRGIFMATHHNRYYCGSCNTAYFK